MKVKGITTNELHAIVLQVSTFLYDGNLMFNREPDRIGNFLHFTLRVKDSSGKGAHRSASGRRTVSACWHAHRDVMYHIFETNPEAILVSALARYNGRDDFGIKFPMTGYANIGSYRDPVLRYECCQCSNEVHRREVINPRKMILRKLNPLR